MSRPIASLLAAASLACGLSSSAFAQCDIYRLDIPDFDQRRQADLGVFGLPGNGSAHCVPASAMNWLAYATNHGYPEILGGARDWQSDANYNFVTQAIAVLGTMMNTDGGTGYADGLAGLTEFLDITSPGNFIVSVPAASGTYAPSPEEIYDCMTAGAMVNFCTSRWTLLPAGFVGQTYYSQRYVRTNGGHCVTVARVTDACSSSPTVWFRDPAGFDGDKFSQAQFVTQLLDTQPITSWYAGSDTSTPIYRTMHRLIGDDPAKNSMINGLYVIIPIGGLSADAQQGTLTVINQHRTDDFAALPDATHSTPGNAPILGVRYLPHLGAAAVLTSTGPDRGTLYRFRPGTGEFQPLATIDSPGDMVVGRAGEIYVASRHVGGVNVCMADGSVRFISTGVYRPLAMAYDEANDRVVMILDNQHGTHVAGTIGAVGNNTVYFTNDYSLTVSPIAGLPNASAYSIVIDPRPAASGGGGVYVAAGDINGIAPMTKTPNGWVIDRARTFPIQNPKNLQIDSGGRLFCTSNGVAHQFVLTFNGQTTTPVLNPDYKFEGRTAGDIFQVTIGRAGRDSLAPPNSRPIDDPSSFPTAPRACPADFNFSGTVTVQDIFDFLAAYFANDPTADFNESNTVTVQDIFDFLAAYFRGC